MSTNVDIEEFLSNGPAGVQLKPVVTRENTAPFERFIGFMAYDGDEQSEVFCEMRLDEARRFAYWTLAACEKATAEFRMDQHRENLILLGIEQDN